MIIKKIDNKLPAGSLGEKRKLFLFFAGWGMDEYPFLEYLPSDRDCMICYDYRSLSFDESLLKPYSEIRVVAWSMGVWAASCVLADRQLPITESIAVNGTIYPVDDERGIAQTIFQGTLDGLNEATLYKFRRRMCGSKEVLERFLQKSPRRSLEDISFELRQIGELARRNTVSSFRWSRVYIGQNDKIFTPPNQERAWKGENVVRINTGHYMEEYWGELFQSVNNGSYE